MICICVYIIYCKKTQLYNIYIYIHRHQQLPTGHHLPLRSLQTQPKGELLEGAGTYVCIIMYIYIYVNTRASKSTPQKIDSAGNPACYFATSRPAGWPNSGRPAGWPYSGRPAGQVVVVAVVVVLDILHLERPAGRLAIAAGGPAMY